MNEETVNSLLSSFDQVVDDYFDKAILSDADHQHIVQLAQQFKSQITQRFHAVCLKHDNDHSVDHIALLQNEIMGLENEIQTLASTIQTYRQCAQQELSDCSGRVDINSCIESVVNKRSHSSYRRNLEEVIGKEVQQITQHLERGLVAETGNQIRRTQRTISVVTGEKTKELTTLEKAIADVHFFVCYIE